MQTVGILYIVGISTRTTNKNHRSADDLQKLWERFYSENISSRVSNILSDNIYAVYTDYKSDHNDEYTAIIGFPVKDLETIPPGLEGHALPPELFEIFRATGKMPDAVISTWQSIWNRQDLKRKYTYDFEVYRAEAENHEADIYVAVLE